MKSICMSTWERPALVVPSVKAQGDSGDTHTHIMAPFFMLVTRPFVSLDTFIAWSKFDAKKFTELRVGNRFVCPFLIRNPT